MFRKVKNYSGRNKTSEEEEYCKEIERIASLKNKRENLQENLRILHYGSNEEKIKLQEQIRKDAEIQLEIKCKQEEEEKEKNMLEHKKIEEYRLALIQLEKKKNEEKKERLMQIQRENYMALISKNEENLRKKIAEDLNDRQMIQNIVGNILPNVI